MSKRSGYYEDPGTGAPTTDDAGGDMGSGDMGGPSDPSMPPLDPMPTEPELIE